MTDRAGIGILEMGLILALWAGLLGLVCGFLYSVGGFFVDLLTIGLNRGTAMAFGALLGMPLLFSAAGFVAGIVLGGVLRLLGH